MTTSKSKVKINCIQVLQCITIIIVCDKCLVLSLRSWIFLGTTLISPASHLVTVTSCIVCSLCSIVNSVLMVE